MMSEPMKIEYLMLENFIYLTSGLKKNKIELNLRESKHPINVFIGGIGTCKTFILSHLQPFATMGTLDIRNQDDQIIEGKDGIKLIHYRIGESLYEIRHEYIWVERTSNHTTKSYIFKDGEELNPTGNVTSFKYIITTEFGLEQSYLRLIRIGDNVTGLLELSATERKTFVASMLESANIILALHKKIKEELRTCTAQISLITNKLTKLESSKIDEYRERLTDINVIIADNEKSIKEHESSISKHNAEIALVAPDGYDSLIRSIDTLMSIIETKREERSKIESFLMSLPENETVADISKKIGAIENDNEVVKKSRITLSEDYENYSSRINDIINKISIIKNDEHLKMLKQAYISLKADIDSSWSEIAGFECKYTDSYLRNLLIELHEIDEMIADITQYDIDHIRKAYMSDATIVSWAREKGEILTGRKINLSKRISNLSFSSRYVKEGVMYTPPLCPTSNCPFKRTHPYTLSLNKTEADIEDEVRAIQNQITQIDKELYVYAEYPVIYNKISSLRNRFNSAIRVLSDIGCLNEGDLYTVLTRIDRQKWYDYDMIITVQEKCVKKTCYYESLERLRLIEEELKSYNVDDLAKLEEQLESLRKLREQCYSMIENADLSIKENKQLLEEYQRTIELLMDKAREERVLQDLIHEIEILHLELKQKVKNADKIAPYEMVNQEHYHKIELLNNEKMNLINERNNLSVKISEIEYSLGEIDNLLIDQKYLNYIVSATSSKEGIPLELVNGFVKGCKDIVNDLIFDIFEDDVQLEEFQIDEKEFYVPYSIDGKYIKDVTKASQGQRSLFSIAIAFAFSQSLHIPYNIPLCDELDAPLHKTEHAKFLSLLLRQMKAIGSAQLFMITHNSALENLPVNFIATTPEDVNLSNGSTLITLYN